METAPLIQAHAAARTASQSSVGASEKHKQAAEHFAASAQGVDDHEALRILNLLEQQHKQLAQIITKQASPQAPKSPTSGNPTAVELPQQTIEGESKTTDTATVVSPPNSRRSTSPVLQRRLARESSSSIANNLANARGIPQSRRQGSSVQPPTTISNASPVRASRESRRERPLENPSSKHEVTKRKDSSKADQDTHQPNTSSDEPFQKFYSTFEGLLSKLSAPLAFAGLPLTAEEAAELPTPSPEPVQPSRARQGSGILGKVTTTNMPDVSRIFSKAALRAVKNDNPNFGGVHESFLVVPTGGGMVSYANILRESRRSQEHSRGHDNNDEGSEEFTDARESPSRSPKASREVRKDSRKGISGKTVEELEMENGSLKSVIDALSKRVYMWEQSSQAQSMAMHASVRTLKPPDLQSLPSNSSEGAIRSDMMKKGDAGKPDKSMEERLQEMEDQLKALKKDNERYERENDKLKDVVLRYRARWEKLKEGARVRREGGDRAGTPIAETPPRIF